MTPDTGSLVLYKNRAARVEHVGDKLEIEIEGGERRKVRPKDVTLLHPGPLDSLNNLTPPPGEVKTAWEILAGSTIDLAELAELIYGAYTPATAWAAWQLVDDGLYFRGSPDEVLARPAQEVAQEQASREAQAARQQAWAAFLERVQAGQIQAEDNRYLKEVERLALGQSDSSRLLRELGRKETPENAHALLLDLDYWDYRMVPYPQRIGLPSTPPAAELPELPQETRLDLTGLPAFAIDDEGNQEPDDALSLDGTRLWVHIADVAALIAPDTPADLEARERGASLYLPDGTVQMLPPTAVRRLGLGLTEISPALSFGLDLDPSGEIVAVEVVRAWVRVTRLTYSQVESRLEEEPIRNLYRLARLHQARRQAQGAISIELPEVKIEVDGGKVDIYPLPPLKSRDVVLEAMLMAGEATARFAVEHDIAFPFTAQDAPDTQDRPTDLAGMFALRRMLKPSNYQTSPAPHAGLGLDMYAQVTSPLRRYLDLVAHQQLRAYLRGEETLQAQAVLERVGAVAAVSNSVRRAERLARRHWTLVYLLQHPNWHGRGIVVDKHDRRATILIPELDLEAQVHLREDLPLNSTVPATVSGVDLPELMTHWRVEG
jgi:exoribonuclease-2